MWLVQGNLDFKNEEQMFTFLFASTSFWFISAGLSKRKSSRDLFFDDFERLFLVKVSLKDYLHFQIHTQRICEDCLSNFIYGEIFSKDFRPCNQCKSAPSLNLKLKKNVHFHRQSASQNFFFSIWFLLIYCYWPLKTHSYRSNVLLTHLLANES